MHRSTGPVTTETENDFSSFFLFCKPGKQEIQANLGIFLGTPMSLDGRKTSRRYGTGWI